MAEKTSGTPIAPGAAPDSKMPKINYEHSPETGFVTREDDDGKINVARLENKVLTLLHGKENFRPSVVRFLRENEIKFDTLLLEGDKPDVAAPTQVIPKRPKMDPQFGDKTPAVVEWFRIYKPNEYKARYGIIGPGKVLKWRMVPNPDEKKRLVEPMIKEYFEQDCILATRKIPGTELPQANDASLSGDDDSEGGDV